VEAIFELLIEGALQLVLELLSEVGFRGVGKLLSNRIIRWVLGTVSAAALAYGGGWWWGDRAAEMGDHELPTSFYVSIGLAVVFGVLAVVRAVRGRRSDTFRVSVDDLFDEPAESLRLLSPVHWSALRLLGFCLVNVAVALGVNAGFAPEAAVLR
jgi:hypothetical protein